MYWTRENNMRKLGLVVVVVVSVSLHFGLTVADDFEDVPPELLTDRLDLSPEKSAHVIESLQKMTAMMDKAEEANKQRHVDCAFYCPKGSMPVAKPKHKVYPDGCGSPGNKVDIPVGQEITVCCDTHDTCYGTFGETRENCDRHLHLCLDVSCKAAMKSMGFKGSHEQGCKMMSRLLLGSIMNTGCKDFKMSQEKATLCEPDVNDDEEMDDETSNDNSMVIDDDELDKKCDKKDDEEEGMSDAGCEEDFGRYQEEDDDFVNVEIEDPDECNDDDVVDVESDFKQKDEL